MILEPVCSAAWDASPAVIKIFALPVAMVIRWLFRLCALGHHLALSCVSQLLQYLRSGSQMFKLFRKHRTVQRSLSGLLRWLPNLHKSNRLHSMHVTISPNHRRLWSLPARMLTMHLQYRLHLHLLSLKFLSKWSYLLNLSCPMCHMHCRRCLPNMLESILFVWQQLSRLLVELPSMY